MENIGDRGAAKYGGAAAATWGTLSQVIRDSQRAAEEEQEAAAAAAAATAAGESSSSSSGSTPMPQGDGDAGQPGGAV